MLLLGTEEEAVVEEPKLPNPVLGFAKVPNKPLPVVVEVVEVVEVALYTTDMPNKPKLA